MRSPHNSSFKAGRFSTDLSTLKNWEKRQKAPFFRELSDFSYAQNRNPTAPLTITFEGLLHQLWEYPLSVHLPQASNRWD